MKAERYPPYQSIRVMTTHVILTFLQHVIRGGLKGRDMGASSLPHLYKRQWSGFRRALNDCTAVVVASPCSPWLKGVLDRFFAADNSDFRIPPAPQPHACGDPVGSPTSLDPFADAEAGTDLGTGTAVEPAADLDLCSSHQEDDVCSSHQLRLRLSEDSEEIAPHSPRSEHSFCSSSSRSTLFSDEGAHVDPRWGELPRVGFPHQVVWGRVGLLADPN